MAGVEFKKYTKSCASDFGHYAHYDNATRADPRIEHANVHIDTTKTYQNYYIGTTGWDETRRRIEARMEQADSEHPPQRVRKDRVGFYSLNVKCPPELEDTPQENEFFLKAYEVACEIMPSVEGAFVHKDEKHEYRDTDTGEMVVSRYEMHIMGAAIASDGRLNGKSAISPEVCQKINDMMQAMCLKEFSISYQTGEGRQGRKRTVEQMEAMSVVREIEHRVQAATDNVKELEKIRKANEHHISMQDKQIEHNQSKIATQNGIIEKLNDALANLFTRFNRAYIQLQKILNHWLNEDQKIYTDICRRMEGPLERGEKAMVTLQEVNSKLFQEKQPDEKDREKVDKAHGELEQATEELEEIGNDMDEDRER